MNSNQTYLLRLLEKMPKSIKDAKRLFGDNSFNNSPHVVNRDWINNHLSWNTDRQRILDQLFSFLERLSSYGVKSEALIIGGSFLSESSCPKDIDFLLLYSTLENFNATAFYSVVTQKTKLLDYRVCPTDAGFIPIIKQVVEFHTLFQRSKLESEDLMDKGCVILVL